MRISWLRFLSFIAALGVLSCGALAALVVFSVLDAYLWRPAGFPDPERVVAVLSAQSGAAATRSMPSGSFYFLRAHAQRLSTWAALSSGPITLIWDGMPESVQANAVTADFLRLFGLQPTLGRAFTDEEELPGRDTVVMISERFWRERFAGSPDVLGRKVRLEGREHSIVGVLPSRPGRWGTISIWRPLAATDSRRANYTYPTVRVYARLRENDTPRESAQQELNALAGRLKQQQPEQVRGWEPTLLSWRDEYSAPVQPMKNLLVAAGVLSIVLAGLSASGLVLARFAARQQDIAVRFALGGRPMQVLRPWLVETALLGLGGSGLGLLGTWGVHSAILRWEPDWFIVHIHPEVGFRTLLGAAAIALAFTVLSSGEIVRRTFRPRQFSGLKSSPVADARLKRHQTTIVVAQIAIGFALTVNAALLVRTWRAVATKHPGFAAANLAFVFFRPDAARFDTPAKQVLLADSILAAVKQIPGVDSVAITTTLPLSPYLSVPFALPQQTFSSWGELPRACYAAVTPDYFATGRIRLLAGRSFAVSDQPHTRRVAIINLTLARQYFAGKEPVGQWILPALPPQQWRLIIGVVEDVRQEDATAAPVPQLYEPFAQAPVAALGLIVRHADGHGPPTAQTIQRAIAAVDPAQSVGPLRTFRSILHRQTGKQRFAAFSLLFVAIFAGVLATAGLGALMSLTTTQRTAEFGVRIALGATPGDIVRLVATAAVRLAAIGVALGTAGALALHAAVAAFAEGAGGLDALHFLWATGAVFTCGVFAATLPAWRAARVDPATALRAE
jgi:putative ABC transport system permease protein